MSVLDQEETVSRGKPGPKPKAKFIQISSGQPYGQGLTLFALDEAGDVWQIIPGREDEWLQLPRQRGHRASR